MLQSSFPVISLSEFTSKSAWGGFFPLVSTTECLVTTYTGSLDVLDGWKVWDGQKA